MRLILLLMIVFSMENSMAKGIQITQEEKKKIARALEGKRIVYLGEPDHWIREKTEYQVELVEYLHSLGFHWVGNERSHIDSSCITRFLDAGEKTELEKCGELGFRGRKWPERPVAKGTLGLPEAFRDQYLRRMQSNDMFLADSLLRMSQAGELHYFGYDVDKIPDVLFDALEHFSDKLIGYDNEVLDKLSNRLGRSPSGDLKKELKSLRSARQLIDLHAKRIASEIGEEQLDELVNLLDHSISSIEFLVIAFDNPAHEALMEAYGQREAVMFEIVDQILEDPEAKVILLGHNGHLPLDHMEYRRIVQTDQGPIEAPGWLTLGSYLNKNYAGETLAIWMLYNQGTHAAPFCKDSFPCSVEEAPESLESAFAKLGMQGLFSSEEILDVLGGPAIWRENGINLVTGDLTKVTDFIYVVDKVTALPEVR